MEIELVGSYAINIAFSDGHDRGIYPWAYLREIAIEAEPFPRPGTAPPNRTPSPRPFDRDE